MNCWRKSLKFEQLRCNCHCPAPRIASRSIRWPGVSGLMAGGMCSYLPFISLPVCNFLHFLNCDDLHFRNLVPSNSHPRNVIPNNSFLEPLKVILVKCLTSIVDWRVVLCMTDLRSIYIFDFKTYPQTHSDLLHNT